jgi:hypothetical protein
MTPTQAKISRSIVNISVRVLLIAAALTTNPGTSRALQVRWKTGTYHVTNTSASVCTLLVKADDNMELPFEWRLLWASTKPIIFLRNPASDSLASADLVVPDSLQAPLSNSIALVTEITADGGPRRNQVTYVISFPESTAATFRAVTETGESNDASYNIDSSLTLPPTIWGCSLDADGHHLYARGRNLDAISAIIVDTQSGDRSIMSVSALTESTLTMDGESAIAPGGVVLFENGAGAQTSALIPQAMSLVHTGWENGGTRICGAMHDQDDARIVSDAQGGAYITWNDKRVDGISTDVYMQHVNGLGIPYPGWPADGKAICAAANAQSSVSMAADGFGNALLAWADNRAGNSDIYAARVTPGGVITWTVPVATRLTNEVRPRMVPDGVGGGGIAWEGDSVYVAHFDVNGIGSATTVGAGFSAEIASDGAGSACVIYLDRPGFVPVLHATYYGTDGSHWSERVVPTNDVGQDFPQIAYVSGGDAFMIAWQDSRAGNKDIYMQCLRRTTGAVFTGWAVDGQPVGSAPTATQEQVGLAVSSAGGVFAEWNDARNGPSDLYGIRVLVGGGDVPSDPITHVPIDIPICKAGGEQAGNQGGPGSLTPVDGPTHGAILVWGDPRVPALESDIYGQIMRSDGVVTWKQDGIAISSGPGIQRDPVATTDGHGGAIVAWVDTRNGGTDIYAQRITSAGGVAVESPVASSNELRVWPQPARGRVNFGLTLVQAGMVCATIHDISGRRIAVLTATGNGGSETTLTWDGMSAGRILPNGVYFADVQVGSARYTRRIVLTR